MPETPRYQTARALRAALEERIRKRARDEGVDAQRFRFLVVFERFLARLVQRHPEWALKGGYAMELRVHRARTTKDIDLTLRDFRALPEDPTARNIAIRESLQEAAAIDLGDFFTFTVSAAERELTGAPYGGTTFPVRADLDGRQFQTFYVDVAVGDPPSGPFDELPGEDWLGFAGIPAPTFLVIAQEQQMAEKVHAYSLPRAGTPNSRVKDLVDMVLLIRRGQLKDERLIEALESTFRRRGTHDIPESFPAAPKDWASPFNGYAQECGLEDDVNSAFALARERLDPVLQHLHLTKREA